MNGEINKNYYCVAKYNGTANGCISPMHKDGRGKCELDLCHLYHRKYPTPEQFKEEYGEEYPDEGIGYWKYRNSTIWKCDFYGDFKSYIAPNVEETAEQKHQIFVCACTPWGKPPNDWRPE